MICEIRGYFKDFSWAAFGNLALLGVLSRVVRV